MFLILFLLNLRLWTSCRLRADFNITYKMSTLTFSLLPTATPMEKAYFTQCAFTHVASFNRVSHDFFIKTICIRMGNEFYFSLFNNNFLILFFCHNLSSLLLKYLKKASRIHIPSSFLPRWTVSFGLFSWSPFAPYLRSLRVSKHSS